MSYVRILTDNVAQIPPEMAEEFNIDVVLYSVSIEGKSYKDGIDITPADLYQRMRTEDITPTTSQPSLGEFQEFFRASLEKGADSILYIAVSASLSGAYSNAISAAHLMKQEYPQANIAVHDSSMATIPQGFLALEAARAAQQGADIDQLLRLLEAERSKVGFAAMLESLKYLARGGRVGKAAYLVGNMINIKPVITIDDEGVIAPAGNIRGENHSLKKLLDMVASQISGKTPLHMAVMHSDAPEKAEQLKQLTQERFNLEDVFITDFTPVMGAHLGPGVLGVGYHIK